MKTKASQAHTLHTFSFKTNFESEILLSFVLKVPRIYLHTHSTQYIETALKEHFFSLIALRKKGTPIEYITQNASFYG